MSKIVLKLSILLQIQCWAQLERAPEGSEEEFLARTHLEEAVTMFRNGQYEDAADLLANVRQSAGGPLPEADLITSRCYEALCLHALGRYHHLVEVMESLDLDSARVPTGVAERVAWVRIDSLFYFRKFDQLLVRLDEFRVGYPNSDRLGTLADYELATHLERGLKKVLEGLQLENEKAEERRIEGTESLEKFLSLASARGTADYSSLPKRNLRNDTWTARVILGEAEATMAEIAAGDTQTEEEFRLHCALLYPRLRPDCADENLKYLADFRADFPNSKGWPQAELEMANVALLEGERLVQLSGAVAAAPYFDFAREWFGRIVQDYDAGIEAEGIELADVWDAREGILRACFWQKDYAELTTWIEYFVSMSQPGDKRWRQGKLLAAMADIDQGQLARATTCLTEVLDQGFTGLSGHDGVTIEAARWKFFVLNRRGDHSDAEALVKAVRDSLCEASMKELFLRDHEWIGEQEENQ